MEDKQIDPLARLRASKVECEEQAEREAAEAAEARQARRLVDNTIGRKWAMETAPYDDLVRVCNALPNIKSLIPPVEGLPDFAQFKAFQEGAAQVLTELRVEQLRARAVKEHE